VEEIEEGASHLFSNGRAMRPRSADSLRKIYRKGAKVAENEELLVICDWLLGMMRKPLLHRSWDILSQAVLGASCSKFCES
jgi:hypothetical protein